MSSRTISIVVATYNVAPYLPEFLASLDRQTLKKDRFEVVFVNDGSTDASGDILADWGRTTACTHQVITTENGGVANARNRGIEVAGGDWLTFCDPDDVLADDYLSIMCQRLRSTEAARVALAIGNLVYLEHETGQLSDVHGLRSRFREGDRIVDIERVPSFIHLATNTGLFRRSVIEQHHIRFDPRIRPVFEDGHFTGVYLSKFDRPHIAVVASASYRYRRGRTDGTSLMQGAWADEGKYLSVPEFGYLDLLRQVRAETGRVPAWAQNMVLYDLFGYLKQDRRSPSPVAGLPAATKARFHEVLVEIGRYLDRELIEEFRVNYVPYELRLALAFGLKGPLPGTPQITLDQIDSIQGLVRFGYYFLGPPPEEAISADGLVVAPVHAKIRTHRFADKVMMYERTGWLPATEALSIRLDGAAAPLTVGSRGARRYTIEPEQLWSSLRPNEGPPTAVATPRPTSMTETAKQRLAGAKRSYRAEYKRRRQQLRRRRGLLRVARNRFIAHIPINRRYANAWLLIDRDLQAQDNAEHLYRYLHGHQRSINAWFVLDPASPDWNRLEREGFRLLAHGSREHTMALLNAEHLISSQIDRYIVSPPNVRRLGNPQWRFTFLQHGVTKDDLSNWINTKPIDLMITVTPQEQAAIVGDYTPYVFTDKEVRLTGFPRHDRLLELKQTQDPSLRTILVMPTWRRELLDVTVGEGSDHPLRPDFWSSSFARSWRRFLASDVLAAAARRSGWKIVFVPHPLMQECLDNSPLPDHVEVRRFDDIDVQATIAETGVMVTDYSSNAFEAAYLQRACVYFQFDRDEFFSGNHSYTRGSWSYETDGFGPIAADADDAVREVVAVVDRDGAVEGTYADRMNATFPFRDGKCSERTYQAIRDLTRPRRYG